MKQFMTILTLLLFVANFATADHCLPGCHSGAEKSESAKDESSDTHAGCHSEKEASESQENKDSNDCDMTNCWFAADKKNLPKHFVEYGSSQPDISKYVPVLSSLKLKPYFPDYTLLILSQHRPRPPSVPIHILIQRFII